MTTQNNKNGQFPGHFQTFLFGLVGNTQEVKILGTKMLKVYLECTFRHRLSVLVSSASKYTFL